MKSEQATLKQKIGSADPEDKKGLQEKKKEIDNNLQQEINKPPKLEREKK